MSGSSNACAQRISDAYTSMKLTKPFDKASYVNIFVGSYNTHVSEALYPPWESCVGHDDSSLRAVLTGLVSEDMDCSILGDAFCDYWLPTITALAVHTFTSHNVASLRSAFQNAVCISYTTSDTQPYFETLFSNVEAVATSIIYNGVHNVSGSPISGSPVWS